MAKNFWMVVQKPEDFEITRDLGFTVHGMKGRQRRRAQRMEPDDNILFYVSGIKKWTAIAVITSRYYEDPTPIWNPADRGREVYPYRVKLRPQIVMAEDLYIDALALRPGSTTSSGGPPSAGPWPSWTPSTSCPRRTSG